MTKAGWETTGVNQAVFDQNPKGVLIIVANPQAVPRHGKILLDVFRSIGIHVEGGIDKGLKTNLVGIRT